VPGRLYAGDELVKGSYMARTGAAAGLRVWLAKCRGVPEEELPHRRAPVCDAALLARARALDAEINRREEHNYVRLAMEAYATGNRSHALLLAQQN